jgi:hypothetical protein
MEVGKNELRFLPLNEQQVARLKNMVAGGWGYPIHIRLKFGEMTGLRRFPYRRAIVVITQGEAIFRTSDGCCMRISAKNGFSVVVIPMDFLHAWQALADTVILGIAEEATGGEFFVDAVLAESEPIHKENLKPPPAMKKKKKKALAKKKMKKMAAKKRVRKERKR